MFLKTYLSAGRVEICVMIIIRSKDVLVFLDNLTTAKLWILAVKFNIV